MSSNELTPDQKDLINSVKFAVEFLKIIRGFQIDNQRSDSLPYDVKEYLANQQLNTMIKDNDLEPEMLIWGLVHIIEIVLRYAEIPAETLTEVLEGYVNFLKGKEI